MIHEVQLVAHFVFLGADLNTIGCPMSVACFRVSQDWLHFWARSRQFCRRMVPLRLRWRRLLETVMRTMFYCAGSFAWHPAAVALVVTAWNKMLGFTLARSKLQDEDWPDFIHRIHSKLQDLIQLFEMPTVESLLAGLHAGWTGHVVRSSMYSCVYVSMSWRDSLWWAEMKHRTDRPKYAHRGAQVAQCTDSF